MERKRKNRESDNMTYEELDAKLQNAYGDVDASKIMFFLWLISNTCNDCNLFYTACIVVTTKNTRNVWVV